MAFAGTPVVYRDGLIRLIQSAAGGWSFGAAGTPTSFSGYAILEAYTPDKNAHSTLAAVGNRAQNNVPADMAAAALTLLDPRAEANRIELDSSTDMNFIDFNASQSIGGAVVSDGTNLLSANALAAASVTTQDSDLTIQFHADGLIAIDI